MHPKRLSKYIRESTGFSHREVKQAFHDNRIVLQAPGQVINPTLGSLVFEDDQVWLDGVLLQLRQANSYWMLNKPHGVLTTTRDPHDRPSLAPWLAALPEHVFPIGRLDRATTGLLLLSDDGDLAFMLLGPQYHIEKAYTLTIKGYLMDNDYRLTQLREGVELGDGPAIALSLTVLSATAKETILEMVIDEGRNRQIRRMCKRVKLPLIHLHRHRIGPLIMPQMDEGQIKAIDEDDVSMLWAAVGGKARVARQTLDAFKSRFEKGTLDETSQRRFGEWLASHPEG